MKTPRVFEALEARRMPAFTTADYLPIYYGGVVSYAGSQDGEAATAQQSTYSDSIGKTSVTLWDTVVSTATETIDNRLYISLNADGLYLHRFSSIADVETTVNITPGQAIHVLRQRATEGGVLAIPSIASEVAINDADFGQLLGRGTIDGTSTVRGFERVDMPDGRFINALKFTIDLNYKFTGVTQGVEWELEGTDVYTFWLGYSLGVVKQSETGTGTVRAPSVDLNETASSSLSLSRSAYYTPDTDEFENGTLRMFGTIFNDVMSVTSGNGKFISTQQGVSKEYDAESIEHIEVYALPGNDIVTIGPDVPGLYIDAGEGNDVVTGGEGPDTLTGGAGKDFLDGGAGGNRVAGNGGHDRLVGGSGADRVYGGNENDTLEGGGGVDRVWGGSGDDILTGGGSNDKLFGEGGNDSLYGGTQSDLLNGGAGADYFFGEAGDDSINALDAEIDRIDGGSVDNDHDGIVSDANDVLLDI